MAIFRNVNMSFWTDTKIVDDFTPEDKYFMLYCLTNQYTNIIGCYEISVKQISNDLGYTKESIENLIKRFVSMHKNIDYDFETKELFIRNWSKYNWSASPKLDLPLFNAIEKVKSDKFHDELASIYNSRESVIEKEDTLLIGYRYPIDTTITITNTIPISIPISNTNTNNISNIEEFETQELEQLIKPNKKTKQKPEKHKYGEYQNVLLTDDEHQKLVNQYSNNEEIIKFLDEYIEEKGYKSKSHYLAIKRWVAEAVKEQQRKQYQNQSSKPKEMTQKELDYWNVEEG